MRPNYLAGILSSVPAWTPMLDSALGADFDYRDLSAGAVASWTSRDPSAQIVTQGTGSAQPTQSASGVAWDGGDSITRAAQTAVYVSGTTLPSGAAASVSGKGWTCTGLTRVPGDGTWWIANHGDGSAGRDGTGPWTPSLVHVSADFSAIIGEILLAPLYSGIQSIQGVEWDTSDDTIWFADIAGGKVRHITTAGVPITSDEITPTWAPNGIARDPVTDAIWISRESTSGTNAIEQRSCVDGTVTVAAVNTGISAGDQLHYNSTNKVLYYSSGANGSAGLVTIYSTATGALRVHGTIQLPINADAIEGIYIVGRTLYVLNDGYYHTGSPALNRALSFSIAPPVGNVFDFWISGLIVPATTGTDAIFTIGDPLTAATVGIGLYTASPTDLRIFAHSGGTGTTTQVSVIAVSPSLTSARMVYGRIDTAADTLTLWVDGTQIGTASAAAYVGSLCAGGVARLGASAEGSGRFPTMTIKALGWYISDSADETRRQKTEGWGAWLAGTQANLPGGHPYKTAPPTA